MEQEHTHSAGASQPWLRVAVAGAAFLPVGLAIVWLGYRVAVSPPPLVTEPDAAPPVAQSETTALESVERSRGPKVAALPGATGVGAGALAYGSPGLDTGPAGTPQPRLAGFLPCSADLAVHGSYVKPLGRSGTCMGVAVEPPGLSIGEPVLIGNLDRHQVDAVLDGHASELRGCFDRRQEDVPDLKGTVVLKFVVGKKGEVASVEVYRSSLEDPVVEDCLIGGFTPLRFPIPRDGGILVARYPFKYVPPQTSSTDR